MADDLRGYYERELSFLEQSGREFAAQYRDIADYLHLAHKSGDPHVERLIQAVAFLAARVHHKLDDEFPEITNALLQVLYPHYLVPIPSMSIAQLVPKQGKLTSGPTVEAGTRLDSTQEIDGVSCRFRTGYPVTLWPLEVTDANFVAPEAVRTEATDRDTLTALRMVEDVLRIEITCAGGVTFAELEKFDRLRFFLHSESGSLAYSLYELLFNNVYGVLLRPAEGQKNREPEKLVSSCIEPVGFGSDEGLLPYPPRSFVGYRLLHEYFAFPEKYLFFDLSGLSRVTQPRFGSKLEVLFLLKRKQRPEQPVSALNFLLGCTPIVNLFKQIAAPILVNQLQTEYRVVPDSRQLHALEVYAIEDVVHISSDSQETMFQPFYSFKHAVERERQSAFWYGTRKRAVGEESTELFLSFVDLGFHPTQPGGDTVTVRTLCTNRDLPNRLTPGYARKRKDFDAEGQAALAEIYNVRIPTKTIRPSIRRSAQWRLISHLSLNYLSLSEGGREALQEILKLYDFSDSPIVQQRIAGILEIKSDQVIKRFPAKSWNGFCRGMSVSLEFDEEKYAGSGVFLFAAVLERFLGLYASLNSFTQLTVTTKQRKARGEKELRTWPPRAGTQILL